MPQFLTPDMHLTDIFGNNYATPSWFLVTVRVTNPKSDSELPRLPSTSATTDAPAFSSKNSNRFSKATARYPSQMGPYRIQLRRQTLSIREKPKSGTPSKRGQAELFKLYVLLDTPPTSNNHPLQNINGVIKSLQGLALYAHSEEKHPIPSCKIPGKSYEQFHAETV